MESILASLMSGGLTPDNEMDLLNDYELSIEDAEHESPELLQAIWEPFITTAVVTSVEADELPF